MRSVCVCVYSVSVSSCLPWPEKPCAPSFVLPGCEHAPTATPVSPGGVLCLLSDVGGLSPLRPQAQSTRSSVSSLSDVWSQLWEKAAEVPPSQAGTLSLS